jgi:hypothetical protein
MSLMPACLNTSVQAVDMHTLHFANAQVHGGRGVATWHLSHLLTSTIRSLLNSTAV